MKKILIIGGSHRDLPLIKSAKRLGYFTISVGVNKNYIAYKYSDKNYSIDFRDIDKLKKIINDENISYIIPGSGELPMLIAAQLCDNCNYDNDEVLKILHSKDLFKNLCLELNINVPKNFDIKNEKINNIDFPVIVKPTNLSGGKGIRIVYDNDQLLSAVKNIEVLTKNDNYLVEEFIDGELIAYSVILKDQKIIYGFFAKEYEKNYYVTTTVKVDINQKIKEEINEDIEKLSNNLNLKDGLLHVQFMLSKNNKAKILEVTRRIPGDLFPFLIDISDGVNYSDAVFKSYLGETKSIEKLLIRTKNDYNIRYCVLSKIDSKLDSIYIDNSIEIVDRLDIIEKGDSIEKDCLVSILIIKNNEEILDKLDKLIYVKGKK